MRVKLVRSLASIYFDNPRRLGMKLKQTVYKLKATDAEIRFWTMV